MLSHLSYPQLQDDLGRVNAIIRQHLNTDLLLIHQAVTLIIGREDRVRPALVALVARALGEPNARHDALAAAVELIHSALALHCEVGEAQTSPSEREDAAGLFGDDVKILLGDLLYTGAFKATVSLRDLRASQVIAKATNVIAQGEVMAIEARREPQIDTSRHLQIVRAHTATLFEAATRGAAILSGAAPEIEETMAAFGMHLGMAHRLAAEIAELEQALADWTETPSTSRARLEPSLPILHAIEQATPDEAERLRALLLEPTSQARAQILASVRSSNGLAYTRRVMDAELAQARQALESLADSDAKGWLIQSASSPDVIG